MKPAHLFGLALLLAGACSSGAAPEKVTEQPSTVEVTAVDFGFVVEPASVSAGEVRTVLINEGDQPHQAGFYKLNEDIEYEDFVQQIIQDDTRIPQLAEGGRAGVVRAIYPGDSYTRPGDDLAPGTYALICSIKDSETGKPHYELGMISRVEIR